MSDPIFPLEVWEEGTLQNDVPANTNWLRLEALSREVLAVANSPSVSTDGTVYIVGSAPTGAFSTFDEDDLTIYYGGTWYAWAPVAGIVVNVNGTQYAWDGSWATIGGGGGSSRNTVSALSTSGSVDIDYALGDYFTLALAGNVSGFTFSNLPGSGKGATLMIRITQDSTARTVAWPASFKWAGASAGSVSTASGAVDLLAITTFDNGTTWLATLAKTFA
jgi:hypothetical protein